MTLGRTARIGNHGLATSFFNEANTDIALDLVKILIESNQVVPGFLEQYRPEGELNFDESDSDEEIVQDCAGGKGSTTTGDAWGTDAGSTGETW